MDGPKGIDVAIRSSRRLFRDALATCLHLQPDFTVVGHVAEVTDLVGLCLLRRPQLLLVDIGGGDVTVLEPLHWLRARYPDTRVVAVYENLSAAGLELTQRMGVATLVPFSHGLGALLVVLRQHAESLRVERAPATPDGASLTEEERKIIALLAGGHPVHRIATMLGRSAHTVENSKRRIYAKLAVTSPSQVVARAAMLGLVDWPATAAAGGDDSRGDGVPGHHGRLPQLTAREADILDSIAMGHTVRQTARMFGIAEKTVENTQARLFLKLGAHSRAGAIAAAHGLGLLDLVCGPPRVKAGDPPRRSRYRAPQTGHAVPKGPATAAAGQSTLDQSTADLPAPDATTPDTTASP